jgi:hypothetical protein
LTAIDPASAGVSGAPTIDALKNRMKAIRRAINDLSPGGTAAGNGTATATAAHPRAPRARPTPKKSNNGTKHKDDESEESQGVAMNGGADDDAAAAAPWEKQDSAIGKAKVKVEPNSSSATPTHATAAIAATPSTASIASNKRKRSSVNKPTATANISESSDEAVSTDAGADTAPESPTPAAKMPRTTYERSGKAKEGAFAIYDGGDSEDDSACDISTDKARWAGVIKKRAAIRYTRDDSDDDFNIDDFHSAEEDYSMKARQRSALCFGTVRRTR